MIKAVDKMSRDEEQLSLKRFYFRYLRVDPQSRQWGMYVTTCGRSAISRETGPYPPVRHPPHYQFDWAHGRILNEYQMIFVAEGSGTFETKTQVIQIEPGTVILLTPGVWHRYRPRPETGWREYWVGFAGAGFKSILNASVFRRRHVYKLRESLALLKEFENLIALAQQNGPGLPQTLAALTHVLLARLYASTLVHSPDAGEIPRMVQRSQEMMLSSGTYKLPLEEIAHRLGTSYSTFRRHFREHTGIGPHQYRLHLKLSQARDLLLNTALSIKEVAFRSGFEDEQYFHRAFKKAMGKTPGSYRRPAEHPSHK